MTERIPPDHEERRAIAEDLDTNILVEAGAGSGKTASLVTRMVNLIGTGRCSVREMAAITFTRKAAAELKERFQVELEKACRREEDPRVSERLARALKDLDQGYIGTIHAFCARLLRERPVEAGLDPGFQELDELEDLALLEEAWQGYLTEVKLLRPHLLDNLNRVGISLENLRAGFNTLVHYPDLDLVHSRVKEPDLRPALKSLAVLLKKAGPFLPDPPHEERYDGLQQRILRAGRQLRFFDLTRGAALAGLLAPFDRASHRITQKLWLDKSTAKELKEDFDALGRDVVAPALDRWREYCHYHVMEFLLPGIDGYHRAKERASRLNYQDLLVKAGRLLRDYPEVRRYFQERYPRLLVDEFQDTDPLQSQVMFFLTGGDHEEGDWLRLLPRPGSLFVVGDPKQSIYRFRRADMDTYNLVKEKMAAGGGRILNLRANFRSLNTLGEYCNTVFAGLLAGGRDQYQAAYSPMESQRPDPARGEYGVRVLDIPGDFAKKEEIIREDARRIARCISGALRGRLEMGPAREERGDGEEAGSRPRPRDFMILLRYKDSMEVYARALEEEGIPVTMTGGGSLQGSMEIEEFLQVVRAVADPGNPVHLAAALRGIFFGISDDCLYRFKGGGGAFDFLSPLPPGLDRETEEAFAAAYSRLGNYYRESRSFLPAVALEKMAADLGLLPLALSGPLGSSRGGAVLQLLEHLRRAEARGVTTFAGLAGFLENLKGAGLEEELSLDPEEEKAVRLMNLHKAKGLEAPVVFLAHPCKHVRFTPDLHVSRTGSAPGAYYAFRDAWSGKVIAQPLEWARHRTEEERYQAAEEARLLYVAATRARNLLVISRSRKDNSMGKNPWKPLLEGLGGGQSLQAPEEAPAEAGAGPPPGCEEAHKEALRARESFSSWTEPLSAPTYRRVSPAAASYPEGEEETGAGPESGAGTPQPGTAGSGAAWGSVIHRVLEARVRGEGDLEALTEAVLKEYGFPPDRKGEVEAFLEKLQDSPLWQRVERAEFKMTEVPFTYQPGKGDGAARLLQEEGPPGLLSGIIDLAFREEEGWVIVDYKTDWAPDARALKVLTERYRRQVAAYAAAFQDLTGERVKAAEIFFLHANESRRVWG